MLIIVFTALFLLAALNYYLGRSFFYPAFAYCAAWTIAVLCLLFSGDMFFPLSPETLSIFMWGAAAFSFGSAVGKAIPLSVRPSQSFPPQKALNIAVTVFVLAFPFYLLWLVGLAADHPRELFLQSTRQSFIELIEMGPEKFTLKYVFFINLLTTTTMIAMIAWAEKKGHMKRAPIAVIVSVLYYLLTGGRSSIIQLLLALICIEWMTTKALRWKPMLISAACALLVFGIVASIVHPSGEDLSVSEKASAASTEFIGYIGGPLVAFDRVVRQPNAIKHTPNAAAFFVETAAKIFPSIEVPSRLSQFVQTGPDRQDNVFTIYFAYLDAGMPLACLLIAVQAFFLTLIYSFALAGNKTAIVMYAALLSCIAFSTFSDFLTGSINVMLKTYFCCWLFYSFPSAKARFGRMMAESSRIVTESRASSRQEP